MKRKKEQRKKYKAVGWVIWGVSTFVREDYYFRTKKEAAQFLRESPYPVFDNCEIKRVYIEQGEKVEQ